MTISSLTLIRRMWNSWKKFLSSFVVKVSLKNCFLWLPFLWQRGEQWLSVERDSTYKRQISEWAVAVIEFKKFKYRNRWMCVRWKMKSLHSPTHFWITHESWIIVEQMWSTREINRRVGTIKFVLFWDQRLILTSTNMNAVWVTKLSPQVSLKHFHLH